MFSSMHNISAFQMSQENDVFIYQLGFYKEYDEPVVPDEKEIIIQWGFDKNYSTFHCSEFRV